MGRAASETIAGTLIVFHYHPCLCCPVLCGCMRVCVVCVFLLQDVPSAALQEERAQRLVDVNRMRVYAAAVQQGQQ